MTTSRSIVSGLMSIKCHEKFKNCMGRVKATSRLGSPRNANMNSLFATHMLSQLGSQLGGRQYIFPLSQIKYFDTQDWILRHYFKSIY
uniref:Uncharacterized protein n=1 Tax=Triticum urartu TaxID=4572 RepID=A0A8R7U4W9_TRIUA